MNPVCQCCGRDDVALSEPESMCESCERHVAALVAHLKEYGIGWQKDQNELNEARTTLAAVRKVAENYHDVDVVGDPPREVACNPCAAEILNVLERKP